MKFQSQLPEMGEARIVVMRQIVQGSCTSAGHVRLHGPALTQLPAAFNLNASLGINFLPEVSMIIMLGYDVILIEVDNNYLTIFNIFLQSKDIEG